MPGGESVNGGSEGQARTQEGNITSLISSSSYQITLKFSDITYRIKLNSKAENGGCIGRIFRSDEPNRITEDRTILNNITGMVSPGEILAILGPSGSGKSTLLNALGGRLQGNHTGTVLANGRKLNKQVLRRTGFVTQDDVLYPHLTVKETLVFCSLLRLPSTLTNKEKVKVAEAVITELGLDNCENTIIGNSFIRGVSGGERKRVSIGHEMLINPSMLLLDEPTSGLDSTGAYRLVLTLAGFARKGKTILTSMHQPSSRVYQMFDSVIVLSEGSCIYFGKGSDAMDYFDSVGFSPCFPMNPADFMLDLANGVAPVDYQGEGEKPNIRQTLISSYNNFLAPKVKACIEATIATKDGLLMGSRQHSTQEDKRSNSSSISWFNQLTILLHRSLKERRHESFNSLRVIQVIAASLLAGSMWWRSDIHNVQDRLGLLYFIAIFWGVFPSFNSAFAFPQERAIFMKERSSGMYTLSSYFMARITGDLPMELVLPIVFSLVMYWMTGLKATPGAFILTLLVLLGYVLVAQGLGLAIGAAIMDAKQASTVVTITMLAFVLIGGFYVHQVPACMAWVKYASFTFYCYRLLIGVQYGEEQVASLLGCSHRRSCGFIDEQVGGQMGALLSISVLVVMFFGYRLLAYIALRRIKV